MTPSVMHWSKMTPAVSRETQLTVHALSWHMETPETVLSKLQPVDLTYFWTAPTWTRVQLAAECGKATGQARGKGAQ